MAGHGHGRSRARQTMSMAAHERAENGQDIGLIAQGHHEHGSTSAWGVLGMVVGERGGKTGARQIICTT
eukprot:12614844-Alexandrium_andersonii.AAC.1